MAIQNGVVLPDCPEHGDCKDMVLKIAKEADIA